MCLSVMCVYVSGVFFVFVRECVCEFVCVCAVCTYVWCFVVSLCLSVLFECEFLCFLGCVCVCVFFYVWCFCYCDCVCVICVCV